MFGSRSLLKCHTVTVGLMVRGGFTVKSPCQAQRRAPSTNGHHFTTLDVKGWTEEVQCLTVSYFQHSSVIQSTNNKHCGSYSVRPREFLTSILHCGIQMASHLSSTGLTESAFHSASKKIKNPVMQTDGEGKCLYGCAHFQSVNQILLLFARLHLTLSSFCYLREFPQQNKPKRREKFIANFFSHFFLVCNKSPEVCTSEIYRFPSSAAYKLKMSDTI